MSPYKKMQAFAYIHVIFRSVLLIIRSMLLRWRQITMSVMMVNVMGTNVAPWVIHKPSVAIKSASIDDRATILVI